MKNGFLGKVFSWLGIGLLVTFLVAILASNSEAILSFTFGNGYLLIIILEFVVALILSTRIQSMSSNAAKGLYLGYSALTGLTFSTIFIYYKIESIIWIFLATAIVFSLFALLGKSEKVDLNKFGIYLLIGLISVIILEIINIFVLSSTLSMASCVLSLLIFVGYVAYDIQRIIRHYDTSDDNMAIIGAFSLYLDFINIFIELVRMFGKGRD